MEFGSDASTRHRVARSILVNGPSTAAALAERLDLTAAAVRRHLDVLLEEGAVESRDPRPVGSRGRGRPAKVFALTETGRDGFDQAYDDLALEALRFLRETGGEDAVRSFAERRVAFVEERFQELQDRHPALHPVEVLAEVFSEEGYAAAVRASPVGDQLCQQHCPVSHVAHEFPQLCEAETAAIARVLDRHVQRLATIAHGDGVCTTCVPDLPDGGPASGASDGPRSRLGGTGAERSEHRIAPRRRSGAAGTPHDSLTTAPPETKEKVTS